MILFVFAVAFLIAGGCFYWWIRTTLYATQSQMKEAFQSLSFEMMERSGKVFLEMAKSSLDRVQEKAKEDLDFRQKTLDTSFSQLRETIKKLDEHQYEIEKKREGAYGALGKQLELMLASEKELRQEASHLAQALRAPQTLGSWGQLHLRRVVELAGLINHCDFYEQKHFNEGEGRLFRPDLVIHLPESRQIAIDAKAPLTTYLEATEAVDEPTRKKKLEMYASVLRKHIRDLGQKEYWKRLDCTPEYVILFLPAESFFSAALQVDPTLIEMAAEQNIIVAAPTTLIAILRAIAFSWKQDSLSKSAEEIAKLGQELHERLGIVCEYWNRVGKSLAQTVDVYNQSIASMEARLLPSAKKLQEKGASAIGKELPEMKELHSIAKTK